MLSFNISTNNLQKFKRYAPMNQCLHVIDAIAMYIESGGADLKKGRQFSFALF